MKILGISGNLRTGSYNTTLLEIARQLAPAGTEMTVADLSDITAYNEDVYKQGFPPSVTVFREQITAADCLLIVTPEYNYGMRICGDQIYGVWICRVSTYLARG